MQFVTLRKKSGMLFTGGRISGLERNNLKLPNQCERLISQVGCYYDPIFMADPKNMAAACMRLYISKNYGKMHV
jgi:hypothetical protein